MKNGIEVYRDCECFIQSKTERIFSASTITGEFRLKTFDKWKTAYLPEIVRNAHKCALAYIGYFETVRNTRQNSIGLLGNSGSGKTHLLMSIANFLMQKNIPLLYFPYVEGFNEIKNDLDNLEAKINKLQKVEVLFIDDLYKGRVTPTPFVIEQLFAIVNYRYMNNLPMLISSERLIEDMITIDEAIGSRIYEMTKSFRVELIGSGLNYRLRGDDDET